MIFFYGEGGTGKVVEYPDPEISRIGIGTAPRGGYGQIAVALRILSGPMPKCGVWDYDVKGISLFRRLLYCGGPFLDEERGKFGRGLEFPQFFPHRRGLFPPEFFPCGII